MPLVPITKTSLGAKLPDEIVCFRASAAPFCSNQTVKLVELKSRVAPVLLYISIPLGLEPYAVSTYWLIICPVEKKGTKRIIIKSTLKVFI